MAEVGHLAADSCQGEHMAPKTSNRVAMCVAVRTRLRKLRRQLEAGNLPMASRASRCPSKIGFSAFRWLPPHFQGVLSAEDAVLAVQAGASGVIVSNHGGRALDGSLSSIESLGPVVKVR